MCCWDVVHLIDENEMKQVENSDYEIFRPHGRLDNRCLNGQQLKFIRRKRDRKCFNNLKNELVKVEKFCKCTEEDYECTEGFKKDHLFNCYSRKPISYAVPKNCVDTYKVS